MTSRLRHLAVAALAACVFTAASAQPFVGCPSAAIAAAFDGFGPSGHMPPALRRWVNDRAAQRIEPFKAFDDAYFVGVCWVSAWLLPTPKGHFLIDTLHEPHTAELLANIRKAGFDPQDIRYVLVTHGHYDHAGGMARLKKELKNARFVMTAAGWAEARASAAADAGTSSARKTIPRDIVATDGDSWTLGGRTVTLLATPGHTLGTASYLYDVHDGTRAYRAVTIGGIGINASLIEPYIASVERLDGLVGERPPVEVHLATHPFATGLMEHRPELARHTVTDPHPLVDRKGLHRLLGELEVGAKERLDVERAKAAAK